MTSALKEVAKEIRVDLMKMSAASGSSHLGCCLSIVDILTVLYCRILNISPENIKAPDRDRFILSKGHASAALYAILAKRGFLSKEQLMTYYKDGGLPGHPCLGSLPGIETSTGSLGHGLAVGAGMAIACRYDDTRSRIVIVVGDGECNEGSIWESVIFAAHYQLDNITLIVDRNEIQGYGYCKDIIDMEPLSDKFRTFGWHTTEIDGHNFDAIEKALKVRVPGKPNVIIASTIHGKGVSFIEDKLRWHYKSLDRQQLNDAIKEIGSS